MTSTLRTELEDLVDALVRRQDRALTLRAYHTLHQLLEYEASID